MERAWALAILGGILIGFAASLMLALNGRITGLSGILSRTFLQPKSAEPWRWSFVGGLLAGALLLVCFYPKAFGEAPDRPPIVFIVAGLLVGFGTRMGGGCTSGHGVCGVSRLSRRSIVATFVFMIFGLLTATLMGQFF